MKRGHQAKERVSCFSSMTLCQGNDIVEEGKFLFIEVSQLINEERKIENIMILQSLLKPGIEVMVTCGYEYHAEAGKCYEPLIQVHNTAYEISLPKTQL